MLRVDSILLFQSYDKNAAMGWGVILPDIFYVNSSLL